MRVALDHFERAVALDPGYAVAYAGIADCLLAMAICGAGRPAEVSAQKREAARRTLARRARSPCRRVRLIERAYEDRTPLLVRLTTPTAIACATSRVSGQFSGS